METQTKTAYKKDTFPVEGMTCASCASSIESMLRTVDGVQEANVNFAGKTVQVAYAPNQVKPDQLRDTLHEIGFELLIGQHTEEELEERQEKALAVLRTKTIVAAVLAFPVFVLGMFCAEKG